MLVTIFLVLAGAVAGVVGTAGGITSLVSYPALLLAGAGPVAADVGNLVAYVVCWPGSTLTSRVELAAVRSSLPVGLLVTVAGTAVGGLLLLCTPSHDFNHLVPVLVLAGATVLVAQPRLTSVARRRMAGTPLMAWPLIGLVAIYAGYSGAGSGVMLLCVALVFVDSRFPEANALKNTLLGAGAVVSAVIFGATGLVPWRLVLPLSGGLFVGGMIGPVVARRLPSSVVRWAVVGLSVILATELWVRAG